MKYLTWVSVDKINEPKFAYHFQSTYSQNPGITVAHVNHENGWYAFLAVEQKCSSRKQKNMHAQTFAKLWELSGTESKSFRGRLKFMARDMRGEGRGHYRPGDEWWIGLTSVVGKSFYRKMLEQKVCIRNFYGVGMIFMISGNWLIGFVAVLK